MQEVFMDLARLIDQSNRYWLESLEYGRTLPGLTVVRRVTVSDMEAVVYEPVICLILQGRKETSIGAQFADLGPGDVLLVSHDLPVQSRITKASPQEPYLAVILKLDLDVVRGLYEQLADAAIYDAGGRSLSAGRAELTWLQALERYLDLQNDPLDARVLGPSVMRELHYRILLSPAGKMLRTLLVLDSHASRVAKAILRLRREFQSPLALPELARTAGMSTTSFHQHFKAITSTTPLQYQKDLRLIAARTLLAERGQTVTEAAFAIGYESPTHFSRDYKRKFGKPPRRDTRDAVSAA
jgi:AraC-like DNA-binding protein